MDGFPDTFTYIALNSQGETSRGQMDALDKQDLINQLQSIGLFLVSCKGRDQGLPDKTSSIGVFAQRLSDSFSASSPGHKPKAIVMTLFAMAVTFGVSFSGVLENEPHPAWPPQATVEKIQRVSPGMTRLQVEQLFTPRIAADSKARVTRYFEPSDTYIEVAYRVSGSTTATDTVSGITSVYQAKP